MNRPDAINPDDLVNAIMEEDRFLRERLALCPVELRDSRGSARSLSFKDTLGHLAFWDSFAVHFFTHKLDDPPEDVAPPLNFEQRNREELRRVQAMPFEKVLDLYTQSTRELIQFLRTRWRDLSEKQQQDFHLPLKHRRHHRLLLVRAFASMPFPGNSQENQGEA